MTKIARLIVNYDVSSSNFGADCLKISQKLKSCLNIGLPTLNILQIRLIWMFIENSTGASNQVEITVGRNEEKQGASRSWNEGEWPSWTRRGDGGFNTVWCKWKCLAARNDRATGTERRTKKTKKGDKIIQTNALHTRLGWTNVLHPCQFKSICLYCSKPCDRFRWR